MTADETLISDIRQAVERIEKSVGHWRDLDGMISPAAPDYVRELATLISVIKARFWE